MRMTEKRALLFKSYIGCLYANNENAYYNTLVEGIPDGQTLDEVYEDIQHGEYDYDIDYLIECVYGNELSKYAKDGFYVKGVVVNTLKKLFTELPFEVPDRIYLKR